MLPRQGEMGENTPFTRKCTSEPSRTLEKATTVRCNIPSGGFLFIWSSGLDIMDKLAFYTHLVLKPI